MFNITLFYNTINKQTHTHKHSYLFLSPISLLVSKQTHTYKHLLFNLSYNAMDNQKQTNTYLRTLSYLVSILGKTLQVLDGCVS